MEMFLSLYFLLLFISLMLVKLEPLQRIDILLFWAPIPAQWRVVLPADCLFLPHLAGK